MGVGTLPANTGSGNGIGAADNLTGFRFQYRAVKLLNLGDQVGFFNSDTGTGGVHLGEL